MDTFPSPSKSTRSKAELRNKDGTCASAITATDIAVVTAALDRHSEHTSRKLIEHLTQLRNPVGTDHTQYPPPIENYFTMDFALRHLLSLLSGVGPNIET